MGLWGRGGMGLEGGGWGAVVWPGQENVAAFVLVWTFCEFNMILFDVLQPVPQVKFVVA